MVISKYHPCKKTFSSLTSDESYNDDHVELVNSVQKHTCNSCLREKEGNLVCRFKFPYEECNKTHLRYTKVHTKDNSLKYRVDIVTARNDPRLNRYQRVQLQGWRANCDISIIVDYQSCLEYLTKYAPKPENMTSVVKDALQHVSKMSLKKILIQIKQSRN